MDSKIYFKEFEAIFTLRHLLKEEYKVKCLDNLECYYIPIEFVLKVGRELSPKIRRVDYVCPQEIRCDQHQFLYWFDNFLAELYDMVENKKFFPTMIYFWPKFVKDNTWDHLFGYVHTLCVKKDLSKLTYSQRLRFLN